jgi:signal peptidase
MDRSVGTGSVYHQLNKMTFFPVSRPANPVSALLLVAISTCAHAEPKLFESRQVTPKGEYTFGIEGPAADIDGNLFLVNLGRPGTIGRLATGAAASEKFAELPEGSVGNSIRFDAEGTMFIADYKKHHIFAIAKGSVEPKVFFSSNRFNQPNDMTIARDGTIYASDPNWKAAADRYGGSRKTPMGRRLATS